MKMNNPIVKLTEILVPPFDKVKQDIDDLKKANYRKSQDEIAQRYGNIICRRYASVGAASALPGVIPGFGTAAQIGIEVGTVSADLTLMLRWMGAMTTGIGMIYGRDIESSFNQEFVKVLGLWCGVLKSTEEGTKRIGTKIAVAQFKRVPGKIFKKINRKVGTTILTKYGTKRGGIAVGKLIPFGVGALVGGGFNLATMNTFKRKAIKYFSSNNGPQLFMD